MSKYLSALFVIALLASPVFGQDPPDSAGADGGLFGGAVGLFGDAGAGSNRGGQAEAPDRLMKLREMLAKANTPLSKDQEKNLNKVLDKEIAGMSEAFQARFGQPPSAFIAARMGAGMGQGRGPGARANGSTQRNPAGPGGNSGGNAGGFRGPRPEFAAIAAANNPVIAEIRRMNDELLAKAAATLKPEQQVVITKYQNDQIRQRGGLDALKVTMNEAGAPLTSEQLPQIQTLYDELNQLQLQLLRESQGQPDLEKFKQLELGTMSKIAKLLNESQRKALLSSMGKAK